MISADHGCDPTFRGRDHTREHVPLLGWRKGMASATPNLGVRNEFADVAATLSLLFGSGESGSGEAFPLDSSNYFPKD